MIVPQQASIVASEMAIDNVLSIKSFVLAVKPLFESLIGARSSLLVRIRDLCRPELVQPVIDIIRDTINDDVTLMKTPLDRRNQRSFAVRVSRKILWSGKFEQEANYTADWRPRTLGCSSTN